MNILWLRVFSINASKEVDYRFKSSGFFAGAHYAQTLVGRRGNRVDIVEGNPPIKKKKSTVAICV